MENFIIYLFIILFVVIAIYRSINPSKKRSVTDDSSDIQNQSLINQQHLDQIHQQNVLNQTIIDQQNMQTQIDIQQQQNFDSN
ncbi:hypothetical protein [Flavobacterium sangjuense]|uniref:Transmembrane protein n=1 Tax=Flavobacterium sangjuense TaxID=2518177 RepID=A0A4P7PU34_9FLAO|nr:hypothetical protein [Flavobacterium sangjuense]QBZ97742.1 hypothetical protein GS03_01240 [Flavobacterium sangjuense]